MQALVDFLPAVAFVVTYWLTKDMSLAIMVIMGAITLQLVGTWLVKRTVSKMLLASAALVIVLGGISLILDDPVFFKWKPTGLYWLFALIFLGSQFIGDKPVAQRMMTSISSDELRLPASIWRQLNLMWVAFFIFAGALNIYVAYQFDEATWVNFKLFGLFGLTFVFLLLQSVWLSRFLEDGDS
jgi:intracellular septation protein